MGCNFLFGALTYTLVMFLSGTLDTAPPPGLTAQNVLKLQIGTSPNTITTGIPPIFKRPPPVMKG